MASMGRKMAIAATLVFAPALTIGCGASSRNSPPPTGNASAIANDDEAVSGLMEHHRFHHHGGVTLFIAMSLDTLGVSPERQAALERIRGDLLDRMDPARVAEQKLAATLADGIAAGSIDAVKVDADVAQVTAAAVRVPDESAGPLNELHALLTPPERAAIVDKIEAHWAVWLATNADESGPKSPERGHLAALTAELGLSADQVDTIRAGLRGTMKTVPRIDRPEIAAHLRAFDDAFRGEAFDAKSFTTASADHASLVGWGAAQMAHFVETVTPVLTPDQRTKLAQRLREHATHDPSAQREP